ncbi:Precorrin-8X methylmutase CbiC/CobH [Rippkaea orientalis PCC 8801]|uniref:Precorrin-8X methylmutase CbiC/CobH n=1 Tax=Rippkaea orientalis (strain PCC 8801 / RF-1) TaxID=41431 RepID=B7K3N4_RIPO1|nr:precorrin-8X methylmutase [Rippkaea orientalis]ACK65376.1 Precorrin-8X methylmutase CbiC/CobH [Rippkaea orientalis PCC 8801]
MEWHLTDAQSLALIDSEIGKTPLSPAEYEIVRRVIYQTADFDYLSLIRFSEDGLSSGAAAIAARSTIVVDVPMVQVGIVPTLQATFANPVYCSTQTITRPQKEKTETAWGMQTLAKRYPEAIFVIGQSQTALTALVELIEEEEIKPALVIGTPSGFIGADIAKERLFDTQIPHITVDGCKGSAVVAVAMVDALVDLAWEVYGDDRTVV